MFVILENSSGIRVAMSPYSAKSMVTYVRRIKSARTSFLQRTDCVFPRRAKSLAMIRCSMKLMIGLIT